MDFGFGTGDFGSGTFGVADVNREAFWERGVPERVKDEDNGDLKALLTAASDTFDSSVRQSTALPEQVDPVHSVSGLENARHLTVESITEVGPALLRLHLSEDDTDHLYGIFPRSERSNGNRREDGWIVRSEPFSYPVVAVDSYETTIDIETNEDFSGLIGVDGGLEVRPPDMLVLIGGTTGVFVDRQDPPDFTRRALYRHALLRDLKVCGRLFTLMGKIYGFNIEVSQLYCIDGEYAKKLQISNPSKVFELPGGSGNLYTTLSPTFYKFDEIPADVISTDDPDEVVSVSVSPTFSLEGTYPVDGVEKWSAQLLDQAYDIIGALGNWKIVDPDGNEFWIEDKSDSNNKVFFYAPSPLNTGAGWTISYRPTEDCREDWKPAAAYLLDVEADEVLNEPDALLEDLFSRIEDKIDFYIPLHIRVKTLRYVSKATGNVASPLEAYYARMSIVDSVTYNELYGDTFDSTDADVQPTDDGVLLPTATFTVT